MTTSQVFYAVHGTQPPRRFPRRAAPHGPARNWKYRAWIRSLPCAVCGTTKEIEAAHTGSDGGKSQKASDYSCVPLCSDCHQFAPGAYHRIGREDFERRTGLDVAGLVTRLNHCWFAMWRMTQ